MSSVKTKKSGNGRLSDRMQKKHQAVAASVRENGALMKQLFGQVSRQTDAFEVLMDEVTMLRAVVKRQAGFELTSDEVAVAKEWEDGMTEDEE